MEKPELSMFGTGTWEARIPGDGKNRCVPKGTLPVEFIISLESSLLCHQQSVKFCDFGNFRCTDVKGRRETD